MQVIYQQRTYKVLQVLKDGYLVYRPGEKDADVHPPIVYYAQMKEVTLNKPEQDDEPTS
jgi:hypothetical protein